MSRNHRTGQPSQRDVQAQLSKQIARQMYDSLEEKEYHYMSQRATILTYFCQYASVQLEDFIDHFQDNNCKFTLQVRNKAKVAMKACDDFMRYFEPLIHPDNKEDWNNDYFQLQYALDNWFLLGHGKDMAYKQGSDAERAKEICRAAALRYHDPMETNLQRTFEAGFREGAAYADLHPVDSITITEGGVTKQVTLKELVEAYTGKSDIVIELKAQKQ